MPTISEAFAQCDCQKYREKYYNDAWYRANLIRRDHRHYDVIPEKDRDRRVVHIRTFRQAKHEQVHIMSQIKDALRRGDVIKARHIAAKGSQQYPKHLELQEYNRVLAPPRILNREMPPTSGVRANHNWLKAHQQDYRGRWIALRHGELVGVAESLHTLTNKLETIKGILLTRVP